MKEIKRVLENNDGWQLKITSEADLEDGEVSLAAALFNKYTGETYFELSWYYEFEQLMKAVNLKCAAL